MHIALSASMVGIARIESRSPLGAVALPHLWRLSVAQLLLSVLLRVRSNTCLTIATERLGIRAHRVGFLREVTRLILRNTEDGDI